MNTWACFTDGLVEVKVNGAQWVTGASSSDSCGRLTRKS